MSSTPFGATIDLALQPSLRALTWLLWLHSAVLAMALAALPPGAAMVGVAAAVAVSWLWTRRHPAFGHGPRALARLTWHGDGSWRVRDASGTEFDAELLGISLVHERLLVLNFRFKSGGSRARALFGDELDPELLRRLRARLAMA